VSKRLRITLAQLNPTVGAISSNFEMALLAFEKAHACNADILMFPELFLTGYFPDDLLFKPQFVKDALGAANDLVKRAKKYDFALLLPTIWQKKDKLYNAIIHAQNGEILDIRFKYELPNDDVFYEKRYFAKGKLPKPVNIKGVKIGLPICEDIWHAPVCKYLADRGAELLLCPNGSPYWRNKHYLRRQLVRSRVKETGLPLLYLNQVGGQDELVFDGASFGYNARGELAFEGESFKEDFIITDWKKEKDSWHFEKGRNVDLVSIDEAPWRACVLGLRDYLHKNHFSKVVLGLSGGIDSAIVAAMAVDALGAKNVHCIMLPYRYTSKSSLDDAKKCAKNLGVRYDIIPIGEPVEEALEELNPIFDGLKKDVTEENIQSRMRGLILMAVSNKLGSMLLTTGNKSEMAVGYATIYGDMNGGFNPIKDLLKMQVYHLAHWRNKNMPDDCLGPKGEVIPPAIISKAPSAELAPNQVDQDSLPPYPVLDEILEGLVEKEMSVAQVVKLGFDHNLVKRIEKMLYISEYKRRQSSPGVKLTKKAFGMGRKYPITNGYRDESNNND
jgi:NAD+ synthase